MAPQFASPTEDIKPAFFFNVSETDINDEESWRAELAKIKPNENAVKPGGYIGNFLRKIGEITHDCLNKVVFQIRFKILGSANASTSKHTRQMLTGCVEIAAKEQRLAEDAQFEATMQRFKKNLEGIELDLEAERLALKKLHDETAAMETCTSSIPQNTPLRDTVESLARSHKLLELHRNNKLSEARKEEAHIKKQPCGAKIVATKHAYMKYIEKREVASTQIGEQLHRAVVEEQIEPEFDRTIEDPHYVRIPSTSKNQRKKQNGR